MNIDTSDSSDDEKNPVGGKSSKLKIVDVIILWRIALFFIYVNMF